MAMPPQFMKKSMMEGSSAEEAADAKEGVVPAKPGGKKKGKSGLPPALQAAIARKMSKG